MPNVFQNLVSCKRVFRELRMLCFFKHDNVRTPRRRRWASFGRRASFSVLWQVLSALDILQPPQIDCFEEMYPSAFTPLPVFSASSSSSSRRRSHFPNGPRPALLFSHFV